MSSVVQLIEKPVKYAITALFVFVVSAYVLGNAYEYLALASLKQPTSLTWDSVEAIAGLSMDRSIRYFVFYFASFLFMVSYEKSALKSTVWAPLVLFVVIPVAMAFIPCIFSEGLTVSGYWATTSILLSLVYLSVNHSHTSKVLRTFFYLLIAYLISLNVLQDGSQWENAIHSEAVKLFGDAYQQYESASYIWFGSVEIFSVAIQIYFSYWLPKKFFKEMQLTEARSNEQSV